ncbi:DUF922 domain-containing Zn-dependent protease [Chelativorans salis]|uniref:DUF922 domain-containing protein n=1 Tax=Chelativorans salis TaxID=2978478 RepID=A0ABT2LMR0_9HYPH|nr:DUF922 domain-containing protein [Chelativorans sp. EGI FJ00035]MCT7375601.1 DUF922 domain-containing protein [Chelativorans sp. EGI FJ00035]
MQRVLLALFLLAATVPPLGAVTLSKTYSYFPIGGLTLPEIERQLQTQGPRLESTGQRHPGATNLAFNTRVDYADTGRYCRIADARVSVKANVILPRWRHRRRAENEVRLIWDTLARDIKRHEDSHLSIAKNHARLLEDTLKGLSRQRNCDVLAKKVEKATADVLAKHDAAQQRFDYIESVNFESRLLRLLRYRLEQIEAGRLPR